MADQVDWPKRYGRLLNAMMITSLAVPGLAIAFSLIPILFGSNPTSVFVTVSIVGNVMIFLSARRLKALTTCKVGTTGPQEKEDS